MTDQIPAEKVRAILDGWERIKEYADWDDIDNLVQGVRALLSAPPRPTLAGMAPSKRAACQWMQFAVGAVIESADDPRITALPAGTVLLDCDGETVAKRHGEWVGLGYIPIPSEGAEFGPWTVLHIPKENHND